MIHWGGGRNSLVDQSVEEVPRGGGKEEKEARKSSAGARVVRSQKTFVSKGRIQWSQ